MSLLAVNAALPEGRQGEVAAALADLVASRQQEGQEGQGTGAVVVAAGMLLPPQLAGGRAGEGRACSRHSARSTGVGT